MDLDGWVKEKLKRKLEGSDWRICGWDTHKESSYVYITKNDTDPDVFDEYDFGTMKLRYSYHDPVAYKSMACPNVTMSYFPNRGYQVELDYDDYETIDIDKENYEIELDDDDDPYVATIVTDDDELMAELIVAIWTIDKQFKSKINGEVKWA